MWCSRFTQAYGLEVPFVSAGMGFLALPDLVAAVSNAGGLGLLGVAPAPAALMQTMIQQTKALTTRLFGIDLIVEDTAFGPCTTVEHIEVCLAERVPVVVFFWSLPPADWVARLHAAGVKVWMTVGSVQQAHEAVNARMDAVIAQGSEAGGHNKSLLPLSSLVPAVVDAVAPHPGSRRVGSRTGGLSQPRSLWGLRQSVWALVSWPAEKPSRTTSTSGAWSPPQSTTSHAHRSSDRNGQTSR